MLLRLLTLIISLTIIGGCRDHSRVAEEDTLAADTQQTEDSGDGDAAELTDGDATTSDASDATPDTAADSQADVDPTDASDTADASTAVGLERLYCELTDETLVGAALRAAACLDGASIAGVLDDAARGFVYGEVVLSGYGAFTYGNCDFLVCLAAAADCDGAAACERARWEEPCDGEPYAARCDGDVLEVCQWNGEGYQWMQVQDCGRVEGGACASRVEGRAGCQGPEQSASCPGYYGGCEGDTLIRCMDDVTDAGLTTLVRIDCGELVTGGTCIETPVGGEAPGPTCSVLEAQCVNGFANGSCDAASGVLSICLYGETVSVSCADYGYTTCEDGGFFATRCVL